MGNSGIEVPEIILVLCHSFLHNAFSVQRPTGFAQIEAWKSARFVANLIIEKQAELPVGSSFAVTSKKEFEEFAFKFYGDRPSPKQKEAVEILRNSLTIIDRPSIEKLSGDDGILVICDTLYSCSQYAPILVTDTLKKKEKAEEFYDKKGVGSTIPYPIWSVAQTEVYLRTKFADLSKFVDKRILDFDLNRYQAMRNSGNFT